MSNHKLSTIITEVFKILREQFYVLLKFIVYEKLDSSIPGVSDTSLAIIVRTLCIRRFNNQEQAPPERARAVKSCQIINWPNMHNGFYYKDIVADRYGYPLNVNVLIRQDMYLIGTPLRRSFIRTTMCKAKALFWSKRTLSNADYWSNSGQCFLNLLSDINISLLSYMAAMPYIVWHISIIIWARGFHWRNGESG